MVFLKMFIFHWRALTRAVYIPSVDREGIVVMSVMCVMK